MKDGAADRTIRYLAADDADTALPARGVAGAIIGAGVRRAVAIGRARDLPR